MLEVLPKLGRFIPFLGTCANVATLLGLLGTIFGLIRSFAAAAEASGAQKQQLLAQGISEALTATSFGLSTALLCILFHGILSMKQQSLIAQVQSSAGNLLNLLVTRQSHGGRV
jgi:biopolymer transport protein ExbB/TolQ